LSHDDLRSIERVCIVACGSSYHAGLVAKYAIEQWAGLPTDVDIASEFRYRNPILNERTLTIGVSQSGETVDTLQGLRAARERGGKVLVVSNVVDSSMAREADGVLYTRAGPRWGWPPPRPSHPDRGSRALGPRPGPGTRHARAGEIASLMDQLLALPDTLEAVLERTKDVAEVAQELTDARDFFYLGRHVGHPVALEGALKAKEISYVRAEGYAAGSSSTAPSPSSSPAPWCRGGHAQLPLGEDVLEHRRGPQPGSDDRPRRQRRRRADRRSRRPHAVVPAVDPMLAPVVDALPLQFLAYWLARPRHDVDRPRNLAKTVTVE